VRVAPHRGKVAPLPSPPLAAPEEFSPAGEAMNFGVSSFPDLQLPRIRKARGMGREGDRHCSSAGEVESGEKRGREEGGDGWLARELAGREVPVRSVRDPRPKFPAKVILRPAYPSDKNPLSPCVEE